MCDLVVNDVFDDLREENHRLYDDLSFEKNLNQILEKIKTLSFVLKNNCICSENIEVFRQLNDLEIDYKLLKAKRNNDQKSRSHSTPLYDRLSSALNGSQNSDTPKPNEVATSNQVVREANQKPTDADDVDVFVHTFTCNECQIKFGTASDLDLHINYIHNKPQESEKVIPKQPFRTITDYLRNYRKETKTDSPGVNKTQNSSDDNNRKDKNFNFISEILKKNRVVKNKSARRVVGNHSCEVCGTVFRTWDLIRRHKRNVHPDYRPFKCQIDGCSSAYTSKAHLRDHHKRKHSVLNGSVSEALTIGLNADMQLDMAENQAIEESKPIVKTELEDVKPSIVGIAANVNVKMEVISDSENESEINERLASNETVVGHPNFESQTVVAHHNFEAETSLLKNKPSKYKCDVCQFTTYNLMSFNKHRLVHSSDNKSQFDCEVCGKGFSKKDYVNRHKKRVHNFNRFGASSTQVAETSKKTIVINNDGQFQCEKCPYKTDKRWRLSQHVISHSNVRPFKCCVDGCKFAAKRRDKLNKHMRSVHHLFSFPNQYVCTFPNCNLRFANQMRLRQHASAHKNKFVCRWTGCQFRTDTFAKLMEHKRREKHTKPEHM